MVGEEWVRSRADQSIRLSMSMGNMATEAPEVAGSSTRSMIGTYEYMSPEQKRGEEATAASDVYAVGLMMYRLLTGQPLGRKAVSDLVVDADNSWDEVIDRAVENTPEARFRSGGEMLEKFRSLPNISFGSEKETEVATGALRPEEADSSSAGRAAKTKWFGKKTIASVASVGLICLALVLVLMSLPREEKTVVSEDHEIITPDDNGEAESGEPAPSEYQPPTGSINVKASVPEAAREYFQNEATKRVRIGDGDWQIVDLPYKEDRLSVGRKEIRLDVSGFSVQEEEQREVTVVDGETATAEFFLTPELGKVTVTTNAPDAEVFDADGNLLGKAGDRLELAPFVEHRLTVRAQGYQDNSGRVVIPAPGRDLGSREVKLEEVRGPVSGEDWTSPSTDMEFVWIEDMGLWVGKYEVTNEEYRGKESDHNSGNRDDHSLNDDRQPVVRVNFDDAKEYAEWLTEQDKQELGESRYRLPTL